jgi:L-methionine (R)-S-oxide reductase
VDDQRWLEEILVAVGAFAGTVHRPTGDTLAQTAAVRIPAAVAAVTARIPRGKGMAGLAWLRGEPVTTCDLQTDASGDVRPGARAVEAHAAAAIPLFGADGALRAVVGFAFQAHHAAAVEGEGLARLRTLAATLPAPT